MSALIGQASFPPVEIESVLNCATCVRSPDDDSNQHATHTLRYLIARQNRDIESIVWHKTKEKTQGAERGSGLQIILSPSHRLSKSHLGLRFQNRTLQLPVGKQELTLSFLKPPLRRISQHQLRHVAIFVVIAVCFPLCC